MNFQQQPPKNLLFSPETQARIIKAWPKLSKKARQAIINLKQDANDFLEISAKASLKHYPDFDVKLANEISRAKIKAIQRLQEPPKSAALTKLEQELSQI